MTSSQAGVTQDRFPARFISFESWDLQHAIAGFTAGLAQVLLLHPLDVIKTRLQVQDGGGGPLPMYQGFRDAAMRTVRLEGVRGLYSGLAPALISTGLAWGIYLQSYSWAKGRHRGEGDANRKLSPISNMLAALEAGLVVQLTLNPLWVVKTRMQLQPHGALRAAHQASGGHVYVGAWDAIRTIARTEGIRGFYRGLGPALLLLSNGAIQLMVYEELKDLVLAWARKGDPSGTSQTRGLTAGEASSCGAASKIIAGMITYPTQVIKSRLQQRQDGRAVQYVGLAQAAATTFQREGLRGFYRGMVPYLAKTAPNSAITFMVYEATLKLLGQIQQKE